MRGGAPAWAHPSPAVHLAPARPPRPAARPRAARAVCAGRGRSLTRSAAASRATAAARPPAWARHGDRGQDGRHRGSDRIGREPAGDRGRDLRPEGHIMIGPTGAVRVMMATRPVDFRKGAEGLAALVCETMGADPFSGAVFVIRAKRTDMIKMICWDGTGVCLIAKRLENGEFRWPKVQDGALRLTAARLSALLEGL